MESMKPEAAPVQPEGQDAGGADPVKAMVMLGDSMDQLSAGLQKAGAPPEALEKLAEASSAYKEFLSILGGNPGEAEAPSESVPPAQPGRPGIAPVKGRNIAPAGGAQGY
jgi:hypothetical protein